MTLFLKEERYGYNIYIKIKEIEIFGLDPPYTLKIQNLNIVQSMGGDLQGYFL